MSGHVDPEALLPKDEATPRKRSWLSKKLSAALSTCGAVGGRLLKVRIPRVAVILGIVLLIFGVVLSTRHGEPVRNWVKDKASGLATSNSNPKNIKEDLDLSVPPRYAAVIEEQARLPQHNLSLPYPEGATGRYVKFTSQINMLGWNNVFSELLLLTYLAYKSRRTYVFQDYVWAQHHYPWPEDKAWEVPSRTPLGALISGPTVGGPWTSGDPAGRSIHQKHWDVVCPKEKVKVIWTHEVKKEFGIHWEKSGKQIFAVWNKILLEEPEKCVEVVAPQPEVENWGQVFDLWLLGSDRILDMWEEIRDSPVSQLLRTSPVVQRAIDRNEHLFRTPKTETHDPFSRVFAVHVRRGDYLDHCNNLAHWNSTFYNWNLLPWLPDRFVGGGPDKDAEENIKEFMMHCLPDMEQIIRRVTAARNDWEKEVFGNDLEGHYINTLFILTNADSQWLDDFSARMSSEYGWKIITSRDIVYGDSQEKDVGMAVDMEFARKSAIFMGNGWSSFTSMILHRRLVDKKIPLSNRFF